MMEQWKALEARSIDFQSVPRNYRFPLLDLFSVVGVLEIAQVANSLKHSGDGMALAHAVRELQKCLMRQVLVWWTCR